MCFVVTFHRDVSNSCINNKWCSPQVVTPSQTRYHHHLITHAVASACVWYVGGKLKKSLQMLILLFLSWSRLGLINNNKNLLCSFLLLISCFCFCFFLTSDTHTYYTVSIICLICFCVSPGNSVSISTELQQWTCFVRNVMLS